VVWVTVAWASDSLGDFVDPRYRTAAVSRVEFAGWIGEVVRAGGCERSPFVDLAAADPACGWVRSVRAEVACGRGRFCPDEPVTRGEAAWWVALAGGEVPGTMEREGELLAAAEAEALLEVLLGS
jgi:hypothetical protein